MQIKVLSYTLLSILFHLHIYAQNIQIEGKIVDIKTQDAIPYSTLLIESLGIGTISNEFGDYTLMIPEKHQNDTIIFSALGFEKKGMTIQEIQKENNRVIELAEKIYLLEEVHISPEKVEVINIGFDGNQSNGPLISNIFGANIGLHIVNNSDKSGLLKTVRYFIRNEGKPDAPFRVRIYSVNPENNKPYLDLLNENVIVAGDSDGGWIEVDLEKYNIVFPKEGLFVMAEWIYSGDLYYYTKEMTTKEKNSDKLREEKRTFYGQVFGCTKPKFDKKLTWGLRSVGYPWVVYDQTNKGKYYNIMINADIEFAM